MTYESDIFPFVPSYPLNSEDRDQLDEDILDTYPEEATYGQRMRFLEDPRPELRDATERSTEARYHTNSV